MAVQIELNEALELYVGSFGRYQIIITSLTSLTVAISCMSLVDIMYLTTSPHFWYMYDGEESNNSIIQKRIDVCKLGNGTPIDKVGAGHWQFDEDEFRASVVPRVNIILFPANILLVVIFISQYTIGS